MMWNAINTTHIFRKNRKCELKIKQLYNTYSNRYTMSYTTYTITINGVKYVCKDLEKLERALKTQDIRLDCKVKI